MFEIELTERAKVELAWFKKREQKVILGGIESHLRYEPTSVTRNRKRLRPNQTAVWELRLGVFRVLYNVDKKIKIVSIERVGKKPNNRFLFRGREEELLMYWNYRVVLEDDYYTLREVYYDEDDSILACAERSIELGGESLEELKNLLEELKSAIAQPILTVAELPKHPSVQPIVKRGTSLEEVRRELDLNSVEVGNLEI